MYSGAQNIYAGNSGHRFEAMQESESGSVSSEQLQSWCSPLRLMCWKYLQASRDAWSSEVRKTYVRHILGHCSIQCGNASECLNGNGTDWASLHALKRIRYLGQDCGVENFICDGAERKYQFVLLSWPWTIWTQSHIRQCRANDPATFSPCVCKEQILGSDCLVLDSAADMVHPVSCPLNKSVVVYV